MALHTTITRTIAPLQHVFNQISDFKHNTFKHPSELFQFCLRGSRSGWSLKPSGCDQVAILYHSNHLGGNKKVNMCHFVLFLPQRNCQWLTHWTQPLCLNHPLFCILFLLILLLVNFSSYCWFLSQSIVSAFIPLSPEEAEAGEQLIWNLIPGWF